MDDDLTPTRLERIDFRSTFAFTRIFDSFRIAIHPSRLMLALLFIVLAWLAGMLMDGLGVGDPVIVHIRDDGQVLQAEWIRFNTLGSNEFETWRKVQLTSGDESMHRGVFGESVTILRNLFKNMMHGALNLKIGFDQLSPNAEPYSYSVIGAVRLMTLSFPAWLWSTHTGFAFAYTLILLALWAILGGALSRQMMAAATVDRVESLRDALVFSFRRRRSYFVAPLIPLLFIAAVGLVLALAGLLFYVKGINILAALFYGFALIGGWIMALLLILWFAGVHLIFPAISAQGSDALDGMARAFSYVMGRPWKLVFYSIIAVIYGALTYAFVAIFIYFMLAMSYHGAGYTGSLEGVFNSPTLSEWPGPSPSAEGTDAAAAALIKLWVYLAIAGLGAFAISYYFAAYSHIYLLLRKSFDGDDESVLYEPEEESTAPPAVTGDADSE